MIVTNLYSVTRVYGTGIRFRKETTRNRRWLNTLVSDFYLGGVPDRFNLATTATAASDRETTRVTNRDDYPVL